MDRPGDRATCPGSAGYLGAMIDDGD
jgi:hypothetical protein